VIARRTIVSGSIVAGSLREINDLAYLHRERVRFHAGESMLLGVALERRDGDGIVVDVREVAELREIGRAPNGMPVAGAFATRATLASELPAIAPVGATPADLRMRLALHEPRVRVCGLGGSRIVPLERLALAPHELPVALELTPPRPGLAIAMRRRTMNDADASQSVGVVVALRVTLLARFQDVRVFVDLDGAIRRAVEVEAQLEGRRCNRELFLEAGRIASNAIPTTGVRSSALARTLPPLVIAALREAFEAAKKTRPSL
jgi:CO/xanthine dehydrogenase FAD-binding subunit